MSKRIQAKINMGLFEGCRDRIVIVQGRIVVEYWVPEIFLSVLQISTTRAHGFQ